MYNKTRTRIFFIKSGTTRGQTLVEALLAIGLMALILPALIVGLVASRSGKPQQNQQLQAISILQTTEESLRSIRESGWASFANNGVFNPVLTGATWSLASGAATLNGFTTQVAISDVSRDNTGTIVLSGGTIDNSTKKALISISWVKPYISSISATVYFTRYLDNLTHTDTNKTDFDPGTFNGTADEHTSPSNTDGDVILASGGSGDWCKPQNNVIFGMNLPKQGNIIVASQGAAFIGTGDGTNGTIFVKANITDPAPPATPSATVAGTVTGTDQTNAIYSDGHYAYLATNNSGVLILDLTTGPPYTQVGTITVATGKPVNGIYVRNNIAFLTSDINLYTFNIAVKTGSHTVPLASWSVWLSFGTAEQVYADATDAYVTVANNLFGLQRFAVQNNGATLWLGAVSNLTWAQTPAGLYINPSSTRAYIAFNNGPGYFPSGFFIVDLTSCADYIWWPGGCSTIGSYNTSGMNPKGMTVVPGNRAIIVGAGGTQQYQVIDLTNETSPTQCGGLPVTGGVSGVSSVLEADGDAYSYVLTGVSNNQFEIIQGGSGSRYASSGTFDSQSFSSGFQTGFNRFFANIGQPLQTTIQMQVAVASPSAGQTCANAPYAFVGPNGSTSAYFTPQLVGSSSALASISATVPFGTYGAYQNPGSCFKYRVTYNTTDTTKTPVLYDSTVNYSP